MDMKVKELRRASRRFCGGGGYIFLRFILFHLLVEEAWTYAWTNLL